MDNTEAPNDNNKESVNCQATFNTGADNCHEPGSLPDADNKLYSVPDGEVLLNIGAWGDQSLHCIALVENQPLEFIVDTGASASLVNLRFVPSTATKRPCSVLLRGPGGETFKAEFVATLKFQLGNIPLCHEFLIVKGTTPSLLGVDFLRKQKAVVNLGELRLEMNSVCVPLHLPEHMSNNLVYFLENITLPARSDVCISTKCAFKESVPESLLETCDESSLPRGVLLGRTLVNAATETLPVRLINLTEEEVKITPMTAVGKLEEVHVLDPSNSCETTPVDNFNISSEISKKDRNSFDDMVIQFHDVFSTGPLDFGRTTLTYHHINTGDTAPIKQLPRRVPIAKKKEMEDLISDMSQRNVIQPSQSPWSSPVVLVRKKDGSTRFCVDYRRLNDVTIKDSYPLPRMDDILSTLHGSNWFSTMDLQSGYWQVEVDEESKSKTAFACSSGLYEFNVMPFGLTNAPATFERLMDGLFSGIAWRSVLVYLDDVIVHSRTESEHLDHLKAVFSRLREAGLKLSPKKCNFFQTRVHYLGHVVGRNGLETDPQKLSAVKEWPIPINKKQVRSFLGLCSYYRKFVENFSTIAHPLNKLTEERNKFQWNADTQQSFEHLKEKLLSPPILAFPDESKPFILDTDASNCAVGAVLSQVQDNKELVIEYYSKSLQKAERNYCVTRRELLAVVLATKHFHHYLFGRKFVIRTDHASLRWLYNFKEPDGQIARWLERLQQYDMSIQHRKGSSHGNADALSRRPCGDCKNCTKAEENDHQVVLAIQVVPENIAELQKEDKTLTVVRSWLNCGERPPKSDIWGESSDIKAYWHIWQLLLIEDDILKYKQTNYRGEQMKLIVLPKKLVSLAIEQLHNSVTGGHLGQRKTLSKVKTRFFWNRRSADVNQWCIECHVCAARKGPHRKTVGRLNPSQIGVPFERMAVDVLGPLPLTISGNRYIVICMDYFTKWPEAFALPNQKTEEVATALVNEVFCRFGVPFALHSDQGRNFESEVFQKTMEILGIEKTRTTPLRPQSDGMVERFNRTVLDYLAKFVDRNQRNWDELLPLALLAYRSAEHEVTKFSPALLTFGRELRLPIDLVYQYPSTAISDESSYLKKLQQSLEEIHDMARQHLKLSSEATKCRYDMRSHPQTFSDGEQVWFYSPTRKKGYCPKLQTDWIGPAKVVEKISDLVYRIQLPGKKANKVIHVNRLAKYRKTALEIHTQSGD